MPPSTRCSRSRRALWGAAFTTVVLLSGCGGSADRAAPLGDAPPVDPAEVAAERQALAQLRPPSPTECRSLFELLGLVSERRVLDADPTAPADRDGLDRRIAERSEVLPPELRDVADRFDAAMRQMGDEVRATAQSMSRAERPRSRAELAEVVERWEIAPAAAELDERFRELCPPGR